MSTTGQQPRLVAPLDPTSVHVSQQRWKYSTVDQSSAESIAIRGGCAHDRSYPSSLRVDHVFPPIPFCRGSRSENSRRRKKRHESKSPDATEATATTISPPRHLFLDAPWLIARNRIESDGYRLPIESRMTVNYPRLRYLRATRATKGVTETPTN